MRKQIAGGLIGLIALTGLTACNKDTAGDPSPASTSTATPTHLPEPTLSMNPTPSKPSKTPVYKTYPKVEIKNYTITYDYIGAWGSYRLEATVMGDKVTEAWVLAERGGERKKAEDGKAYTINELLEAADNNPNATVEWPADSPHPTSIAFDNPDAFDDEQKFVVRKFEETK